MNRRQFQDGSPPWSFFIPITLAVVLGLLIADGVRFAIGMVFVEEAVAEAPLAAPRDAVESAPVQAATAPKPAAATAPTRAPPPKALEPERLPGPSSARRNGDARACINGTVALRVGNGWEQEVLEDAPARCVATSP